MGVIPKSNTLHEVTHEDSLYYGRVGSLISENKYVTTLLIDNEDVQFEPHETERIL